jgi:hypothetical protein
MAIPPVDEDPAPHFAMLRDMAARNGLTGLSMGMSADFEPRSRWARPMSASARRSSARAPTSPDARSPGSAPSSVEDPPQIAPANAMHPAVGCRGLRQQCRKIALPRPFTTGSRFQSSTATRSYCRSARRSASWPWRCGRRTIRL